MNLIPASRPAASGHGVFLSAGEISGDLQAAHLAAALLRACPDLRLYGCGGEQMGEAGVDVRVQTAHLGYVGIREGLPFHDPIRRAHRQVGEILQRDRPDIAVLVDGERFNIPLIRTLRRLEIPFIYYFVPLVWFWGRWRARRVARYSRLVIPAFPQEREIFRAYGTSAEWFGHPLLDVVRADEKPADVLQSHGFNPASPLVGLMPGSRAQEVENFTPLLLESARRLLARRPGLQFVLPVASPRLLPRLRESVAAAGLDSVVRLIQSDRYTCLSRCEVVLMASGTATLEVALLGVPMVVFYRVHPMTYVAARALIRSRFVSLPNILLDRPVVPELLQGAFTAESLTAAAAAILDSPEKSRAMREELARIRPLLGGSGAAERAARRILREITPAAAPASITLPQADAVAS